MTDKTEFGEAAARLRLRREALGLSLAKVASQLGISSARYAHWEKTFGPLPQARYGKRLADLLAVDFDWLVRGQGEAPGDSTALATSVDSDTGIRNRLSVWSTKTGRGAQPSTSTPPMEQGIGERDDLALRALKRRLQLRLPRHTVAARIQVSPLTLRSWEQSLPAKNKGAREDSWEEALQVPKGWLRNGAMQAPIVQVAATEVALDAANPRTVADEILAIGAWLSRSRLPRSVRLDELESKERRRAEIFAARYGVLGPDATLLQVIGDAHGLTRERIRQVVDKMLERARGVVFRTPLLDKLRSEAGEAKGLSVRAFEKQAREILGLLIAISDADRFGREVLSAGVVNLTEDYWSPAGNGIGQMLGDLASVDFAKSVRDCSRRMIRSCGAAHVHFVTGMVSDDLKIAVNSTDVRNALTAIDGMDWLTEDQDWYWLGTDTASNRALETIQKTLAVAGQRLDVEVLQQAIARGRRRMYDDDRASPPAIEAPRHILKELLTRVPWLKAVQYDDFTLSVPIAKQDVLSESEMAVERLIREQGGAATRGYLTKQLVDTGLMSSPMLNIVLTSSPIVNQLAFGIYGLRGVSPTEGALSAAQAMLTKSPASYSHAGGSTFAFELLARESAWQGSSIALPAAIVSLLTPGTYKAIGALQGEFTVGDMPVPSRAKGLSKLVRALGLAGDIRLLVTIDPSQKTADFELLSD